MTTFTIEQDFVTKNKWTRPGRKISPKGMAWHWTGNINKGADAESTHNFFKRRHGSYGSAHFSLDDKPVIYQTLPEDEMGYHVGAKKYYTSKFGSYPNSQLLGTEICVNSDSDFKETYERAVKFGSHICKKYGWKPHAHFVRHYDVTRKDCPLMMTDLVHDDAHVRSSVNAQLSWSKQNTEANIQKGIKWIQEGMMIDGKIGNALWEKFLDDVQDEINGVRQKKKVVYLMSKYFADLSGHWSEETVEKLHERGIFNGTPAPKGGKPFARPNDSITRAESAVLIERAIQYVLKELK